MSNALIPRETVHGWSDEIAADAANHQASLQRLLKSQRRLSRYIETQRENLHPATAGVCIYMTSVIARMFDLARGSLRTATWQQLRAAEAKVQGSLDALLPIDDGFVDRFHALDRAQAHILDEAAMVLFQREPENEEEQLDKKEALKVLLVSWVVTEVLDANWRPPKDFTGEAEYAYVHIDPNDDDDASEDE
jgi:hypothetical protein